MPTLSIEDAEVHEAPNAKLVFAVTLSEGATQAVTFHVATSDGSATAGIDYFAKSKTKTFAASQTSGDFTVQVIDDAQDEDNETLRVTLLDAGGDDHRRRNGNKYDPTVRSAAPGVEHPVRNTNPKRPR